ncbi:MAG: sulfatase-like hydrolase/transferase [Candidatus Eisenbacteria bacterium]
MTRPGTRGWVRVATACIGAALAVGGCSGPSLDPGVPRHVVVISIDTARADHFGFLGSRHVRTPGLDGFAREAIVFTDYMTVVPTTLASHATLFTGKYPLHHGTPRNGFMINDANEMLPETLQRAGFRTAGFAGSFALDERFGFAQGFDHYDQEFDIFVGDEGADQNQRLAGHVTDAVIEYLDAEGVPDRLFLFAHYFDPHAPYTAPPPYDTMYDQLGTRGLLPAAAVKRRADITSEEAQEAVRRLALAYAAEISYTDEHVTRLLDDLRQRGVLDDALVVITSDHGECLWEHDEEFDHGRTVYQATMHAVCAMRLPGGELGGTRVDELVANIDVLPTVLDLLGLEVPAGTDGESMPLRVVEEGIAPRVLFGEASKPRSQAETDPRWTNIRKARCIRDGRHKFVWTPYLGTEELYDVAADPHETSNLLELPTSETPELAADMRARLEAWTDSADPLPSTFDPSQTEESVRRLRSLGYLQ